MRPEWGHLTPKMNIGNLFYQKLDAEYLLIQQFFQKKKTVFSEKTGKNCLGDTFHHFLGKEGVLTQPNN